MPHTASTLQHQGLFLMPQHAVDIPSPPNVSPPSGSLALLCQAPLAARSKERAVLLCCVVTATLLLATALPAHSTIMPASAGRALSRYTQLGGVGEAGSPLKEKYRDKLMRSCYEALSLGENCVAPGKWLFEVQISKLLSSHLLNTLMTFCSGLSPPATAQQPRAFLQELPFLCKEGTGLLNSEEPPFSGALQEPAAGWEPTGGFVGELELCQALWKMGVLEKWCRTLRPDRELTGISGSPSPPVLGHTALE